MPRRKYNTVPVKRATIDVTTLGGRMTWARLAQDRNILEVAASAGLSGAGLSVFERNLQEPSAMRALAIADALSVSVEWLLRGDEPTGRTAEVLFGWCCPLRPTRIPHTQPSFRASHKPYKTKTPREPKDPEILREYNRIKQRESRARRARKA